MAEKTKDTLFIDMKYVILYRKLGFEEIGQDIFFQQYSNTSITIYSEEQRFEYNGESMPLFRYKDFSTIECIDRLLKKGYKSNQIVLNSNGYDIAIFNENELYCGIFTAGWGKEYEALIANYKKNAQNTECLYASQLSGGLIDFKSKIYQAMCQYTKGIFEREAPLFKGVFTIIEEDIICPSEFVVKGSELLKYLGNSSIVEIPDGITRIGTGAFWNNTSIIKVVIPESVTCICGDAFVYCDNLNYINIPKRVCEIGDDPFAGCKDIVIDNCSSSFINEDGVLFDKDKKTLIHYTASKPNTEYTIPESVTWIGKHSFYKCENLLCVTIGKNVKFMGNNAFSDCRNIKLKNESDCFQYVNGVLYDKMATTCMHYSMGSGIKVVKLLDSVRTVGRNCFWNCDMIEKIVIPSSVRQIGYNPFANCSSLTLENHSPYYSLDNGILYDSKKQELVYCPPTAVKDGEVIIAKSVINIGRSAFTGCHTLKNVALPQGLKYISRSAFSGCTSLKEITIPQSVKDIADWCFNNCTRLERIYLPKKLALLPNALKNCPAEIIRV